MASFSYPQLTTVMQIASAAAGSIFVNAAGVTTMVSSILLHNVNTGTSRTFTLYMVPNSGGSTGTAGITNEIAKVTISAGDTVFLEPQAPWTLANQGDAIFALSDGSGCNIQILGAQYS